MRQRTDLLTRIESSSLSLIPFAFILSSCVTYYVDTQPVDLHSNLIPRKAISIYYHVNPPVSRVPYPYQTGSTPGKYAELERVFAESRLFLKTIPAASDPPERGIYCSVDVTPKMVSWRAQFFIILTLLTLFILPSYDESTGYFVRYELYVDHEFKKMYRYEITRAEAACLGLLPFVWVNLLTPSGGRLPRYSLPVLS